MLFKEVIVLSARQKGTLCVFLAAVLYSTGGICMKWIPWSGVALNGGRSMIALAVFSAYLLLAHHRPRMNRWVLLGAVAVCGTNVLFAVANKMTTAANAIVLQYTAPVFVIVLSLLFLHKRAKRLDLEACIVVSLGILCFFVESLSGGHLYGDLIALASGLTYAIVFMLNDMPEGDPLSSVFWGAVFSCVIGLPFLPTQSALDPQAWISLLVLGVFQMGLAFLFLVRGLENTPPVTASLVSGIEPVLNPIFVALFYGERMGLLSLAGAVIVIGGIAGYNVLQSKSAGSPAETSSAAENGGKS